MKKLYKGLIIAGSIVLSLGVFAGSVIWAGTCDIKYHAENPNPSWMETIKDDAKLNEIVIPGSHDAATYSMPWMAETQCYNTTQQLMSGVRYFDLRTHLKGDDLFIFHSIVDGVNFNSVVSSIRDFISVHTSETLILDFQHFKGGSEQKTYDVLQSSLGSYIHSKPTSFLGSDLEYVSSLTLGDVRGQVLLFWGDYSANSMALTHNDLFARNDDKCTHEGLPMNSYYYGNEHKGTSKSFIENTLPKYIKKAQEDATRDGYRGLFVLQCQLTDGAFIFGPWTREFWHQKNMTSFIDGLKTSSDLDTINIVMRDFVTETKIKQIIDLNDVKGLLK